MWILFKESYRFFRRHLLHSSINLGGLSIGIAVFFLIQLYVHNQRSYDVFWEDHSDIFRVSTQWLEENEPTRFATAPSPLAPRLKEYQEVEAVTRLLNWSHFTLRPDNDSSNVFRETNVFIADGDFFKVFQGRLLAGSEDALRDPGNIVLSERAALKYFGDISPDQVVGRNLLGGKDAGTLWKITGVMKDIPVNSHMNFDIMVSMWDEFSMNNNWGWNVMHTYVRLNTIPENFEPVLSSIEKDWLIPFLYEAGITISEEDQTGYEFVLQPISNIHLSAGWRDSMQPGIRDDYLMILSLASLLIIFLACFNFMNISTALSYSRLRDIGIRKIHGAGKGWLTIRFLTEFLCYSLVAMIIGAGLVEFFSLLLNDYFNLNLSVAGLATPKFLKIVILLLIVCTLLSGAYPTWVLVQGSASRLLKGQGSAGGSKMRNGLIVVQFCIAVFIIGFAVTMNRQLNLIKNQELGFTKENLLIIQNDKEIEEMRGSFINEVTALPGIENATFATGIPALQRYQTRDFQVRGSDDKLPLQWYETDENFVETMQLTLIAGSGFTENIPNEVIINESAMRQLQLADPIGTELIVNAGNHDEHKVTIKGVVRDFHQQDFREETQPLVMEYLNNFIFKDYVAIRFKSGNPVEHIEAVREVWHRFEPQVPMQYYFFDDSYNQLFTSENMLSRLFKVFSILGLVIAGFGLFGVVAVTAKHRTREIGIRKVLGASTWQIIGMMLFQFITLVVIGLSLALPLSWYASFTWLQDFVFKVNLSGWSFLLTGVVVLALAMAVVSLQAWRSSLLDPVDSIRTE